MPGKIETDEALKLHVDAILASSAESDAARQWRDRIASFLAEVRQAVPHGLEDPEFLRRLWDDNPVAKTGAGTVRMDMALQDADFRSWFASEVAKPLPADEVEVERRLTHLYDQTEARLIALCRSIPRLKMNRALCALFPAHFTSLVNEGALRILHRELGGSAGDHPVRAHRAIRTRIDGLLGPVAPGDDREAARRISLPWLLYVRLTNEGGPPPQQRESPPGDLVPLPAASRRKGLTAIRGSFDSLLRFVVDLRDGLTKEEFAGVIKAANPDLAETSINAVINVISREFDLCRREGSTYRLTARGLDLLETKDPDVFADHLLTNVIGVDHVVTHLARTTCSKTELIAMLKRIHQGWTSNFAPASLLHWLTALDVLRTNARGDTALTDRGRRWAEMVTWEPEFHNADEADEEPSEARQDGPLALPTLGELQAAMGNATAAAGVTFPASLVAQLHCALWFHPVRHFAVLCGISGSGKTQLALQYALALTGTTQHQENERVKVIPVQPGWYDPVPLLGYVSPLREDAYRSAPFLDLLLRAADDPARPYVAILDEMNLSHPEQYLAPLLSAMETHGWLDLHDLGEDVAGVPDRVRYPANLAILGTLNMDETTHGLSDKLLDRAYILEFWDVEVDAFPGWKTSRLPADVADVVRSVLGDLANALAPVRLHFGWRTIDDVLRYLEFRLDEGSDPLRCLDELVYAKVLPKLRGDTSAAFEQALAKALEVMRSNQLARCATKVAEMQRDLQATGSTRFWR